jgi:hypothetical protein
MQHHANIQAANRFRPGLGLQGFLAGNGTRERIAYAGKGDQERIAGLLDFLPSMAPKLRSQQGMMGGKRGAKCLFCLLPERRRTFDIGPEEGDRAGEPERGGGF